MSDERTENGYEKFKRLVEESSKFPKSKINLRNKVEEEIRRQGVQSNNTAENQGENAKTDERNEGPEPPLKKSALNISCRIQERKNFLKEQENKGITHAQQIEIERVAREALNIKNKDIDKGRDR